MLGKPLQRVVLATFCLTGCLLSCQSGDGSDCAQAVAGENEYIAEADERRFKVSEGEVYTCESDGWVLSHSLRDALWDWRFEKTPEGCLFTSSEGEKFSASPEFSDDFEQVQRLKELFSPPRWTTMNLQSPAAPTIEAFNRVSRAVIDGSGNFVDNSLQLTTIGSTKALSFSAVEVSGDLLAAKRPSKSLIAKENICFMKGDDLWFSANYYLDGPIPITLADFETSQLIESPGPRIIVREGRYAGVELKFADKPSFFQNRVSLPQKKWFRLKLHLHLSDGPDGLVELWQDGQQLLREEGKNLPLANSVLHRMQVGITATHQATRLLIDDVVLSAEPL